MIDLQAAKDAMRQRCFEVALANTPSTVLFVKIRKSLSGRAYLKEGVMGAPRPSTRKALYIYLHECGHFAQHVASKKTRHVEEYEAEQWAHARMREAGLAVPRVMTIRAKKYVAFKIRQAERRGAKRIDASARKFASK